MLNAPSGSRACRLDGEIESLRELGIPEFAVDLDAFTFDRAAA